MKEPHHLQELSHRLKEGIPKLEQQFTHLEQEPPNKPNFLLVVILFGAALIVIFLLALLVLHLAGGRFGRHTFRKNPTSQLVLPSTPLPPLSTILQLG